jgi:transposase
MFPTKTFVSERRAANLLEQVRWRDGGSRRIKRL